MLLLLFYFKLYFRHYNTIIINLELKLVFKYIQNLSSISFTCFIFRCETRPALVNFIFQPLSWSQTFNLKVPGHSRLKNTKSLIVTCKFLLCSKKDPLSLCVTDCRGFKRKVLKGSEPAADKLTFFLHVGPLPIITNEQNGEDEKLTLG